LKEKYYEKLWKLSTITISKHLPYNLENINSSKNLTTNFLPNKATLK
jgi:hypothetical protein